MANEFNIKNGFISANDSVVNGKLTTQNLRIVSGATSGYVLTSDASGNAIWQPTSGSFTGGTVTGSTIFTNGLTANTISATTYQNLPIDVYVTGGTYSSGTLSLTNITGGTFNVTGFYTGATDVFVTGGTYSDGSALFTNNTGGTFSVVGFYTGGTDVFVTGGTYSAGTASFTNNTGSTFSVTGFSTFQYFISGTSPSGVTLNIGDRWYNDNNGVEYVWNYDGNSYQWVQPAGIPGPQGLQGIQGVSGNTGPQGIQGDSGFSGLLVTTGITATTQTLSTGYTYYGIVHSNNVDLTLPNPTGIDGFNLNIKDESGTSGIYRIRITTPVGTIDGGSYVDMNINYMSLQFLARNNNWWII